MRCHPAGGRAVGLAVLLSWAPLPAKGHFLWLREDQGGNAVVTFGEQAGVPGALAFLTMVAGKTKVHERDAQGTREVALTVRNSTAAVGVLAGELGATSPPFGLRLDATFGLFRTALLQYWGSADVVSEPEDWPKVQDWAPSRGLEITIRDPWAKRPGGGWEGHAVAPRLADPGDQCSPDAGPFEDGDACVTAMIRFNGRLSVAGVDVTTFGPEGTRLRTTMSQTGVVVLKVPYNKAASFTPVWAMVNYREDAPGEYEGQSYTTVDHWATTYARLRRTSDLDVEPALVV